MKNTDGLLAIDVGTTAVKAVVVAGTSRSYPVARVPLTIRRPRRGWVEQDPLVIARATERAGAEALRAADLPPSHLAGLALSFQRSTCLLIDPHSGKTLSPAVNWQCWRAIDLVRSMRTQGLERRVRALTGLPVSPQGAAPKLAWLWQGTTSRNRRRAAAVTLDAYITHRLTGGRTLATDPTIASRTLLHDPRGLTSIRDAAGEADPNRSATLRGIFGLQEARLPAIRPTVGERGRVSRRWQRALPAGIPVLVSIGDQQAALVGCRGRRTGQAALTFGTGIFVLGRAADGPARLARGFLPTVVVDDEGRLGWGLEGGGMSAAAALGWLETLGRKVTTGAHYPEHPLTGPLAVPAMSGLGPPWHRPGVRTLLAGISPLDDSQSLSTALLEGICWLARDLLEGLEQALGHRLRPILTGGLLRLEGFASLAATVLDRPLSRAPWTEATALGAGLLAARQVGLEVPASHARPARIPALKVEPVRRAQRQRQWRASLEAARSIARHDS